MCACASRQLMKEQSATTRNPTLHRWYKNLSEYPAVRTSSTATSPQIKIQLQTRWLGVVWSSLSQMPSCKRSRHTRVSWRPFSEKPFIFTPFGTHRKNGIIIFVPYCSVRKKKNLIIKKFLINRVSFTSRLDLSRLSFNLPCYKTIWKLSSIKSKTSLKLLILTSEATSISQFCGVPYWVEVIAKNLRHTAYSKCHQSKGQAAKNQHKYFRVTDSSGIVL